MIGQTFQPGTDTNLKRQLNTQAGPLSPTSQEALRVLSLRLPQVLSGRPIAPADLLKPRVGGANPSSAVLDTLRQGQGAMPGGIAAPGAAMAAGGAPGGMVPGKRNEYMALLDLINNALSSTPSPYFQPITTDGSGGGTPPIVRTDAGNTVPLSGVPGGNQQQPSYGDLSSRMADKYASMDQYGNDVQGF